MERVVYAEPGSSWWPVLWGPLFALAGYLVELLTGPASGVLWGSVALGLVLATALWVNGRRQVCSVRLTPEELRQGRERLPLNDIAAVEEVGTPTGVRVLGGGWTPPRGTTGVPIRLADGSVVLGWARDPESFLRALNGVVRR
ncbi:hypothetical protein Lesp02_28860 [Lentzea sp. NBRC 105346]|uniref:DUF3093 family protein n=1 Tax=Lentzea sp. NBRC 105346 TaxID=3032205 RepID=UPI002552DBB8|nr:DUF3093 family protein [Lentzea sp. NBRC 105346]GLZ30697.1 hypothetical protein Lesp02_28860 [Lentzea sp. NBRC 105346]